MCTFLQSVSIHLYITSLCYLSNMKCQGWTGEQGWLGTNKVTECFNVLCLYFVLLQVPALQQHRVFGTRIIHSPTKAGTTVSSSSMTFRPSDSWSVFTHNPLWRKKTFPTQIFSHKSKRFNRSTGATGFSRTFDRNQKAVMSKMYLIWN